MDAAGTTANLWLVGVSAGGSGAFRMGIQYRWVDADCNVIFATAEVDSGLIDPNANCA